MFVCVLVDEIVKAPNQTQSDSFYFVEGKLGGGSGPKASEGKSALSEGKSGGGGSKTSAGEGKFGK